MTKLNDLKKVVNKVKSFEIVDDLKESLSDIEMKELVEEEIKKQTYSNVIKNDLISKFTGILLIYSDIFIITFNSIT